MKFTGKIYLVGDSTVCDYEKTSSLDDAYLPRYGYGTQLYNYINCNREQIENLALSGRSSLSYLSETYYATLKNSISEGDYLIIGFGHNDEKDDDAARYTNPNKSYADDSTTNGPSFRYTLYENYIKLAKDKNATPILCTPIVRYDASNNYSGSTIHVTSNGDYAAAIKTLGEATQTAVVDLTTITKDIYSANNDAAKYYHCHTTYQGEKPNETPGGIDTTHLNMYGAKMVAYELVKALPESCPLVANVKTDITAPTYDKDFASAIKENYKRPDYVPFDPVNTTATKLCTLNTTTPADWYATAFGDLGGDDKVPNYTESYAEGKFTVGNNGATSGKFTSGSDGFGAAFIQIGANKNFIASATVKITTLGSGANSQSGFGMMIRDDIRINEGKVTLNTNYIAAGVIHTKSTVFSREETKLKNANDAIGIVKDKEYTVTITRLGQNITATFSDGISTYTGEYLDVKLNSIDSNYMYLCLFANRGIVAEFSNVQFEITGDAQGA